MNAIKFLFVFFAAAAIAAANPLLSSTLEHIKLSEQLKRAQSEPASDETQIRRLQSEQNANLQSLASEINAQNLNAALFKTAAKNPALKEFFGCLKALNLAYTQPESADIEQIINASISALEGLASAKNLADATQPPGDEMAVTGKKSSATSATAARTSAANSATAAASDAAALIIALKFLLKNQEIFQPSIVLSAIDLSSLIARINALFPAGLSAFINIGKLCASAVIFLLVFFGFRRLVLRLLSAVLARLNISQMQPRLRRCVVALFFVYTVKLCTFVFFYPAPISPFLLRAFAFANVIFIAWAVILLFNNYGTLLIVRAGVNPSRRDALNLVCKIANYLIIAAAILAGASALGYDVSAIIASLGIGGLAVALAAKDIIANFFSSVMLHFDNSFSQGDWVQIGATEGTVVEIGMRKTTIRTFDNSLIFVPNSQIIASPVRNWSRRKLGRKIGLSIGLEYSCSAEQVAKIMADIRAMLAAHEHIAQPGIDSANGAAGLLSKDDLEGYKNTQFVYLDEFAASSINIYVYCFSKSTVWGEFLRVKEDVMLQIMRIVEANGAGFAFPSQSVYIEKLPDRRAVEG